MPPSLLKRLLQRHRLLNSNPDEHTPAPAAPQDQPQDTPEALPPGDTQEPPATVVTVETPAQVDTPASDEVAQAAQVAADGAVAASMDAMAAAAAAEKTNQEIEEVKKWQQETTVQISTLAETIKAGQTSLIEAISGMASNLSALMEALTVTEPPTAPETPPPPSSAGEVAPEKMEAPEAPPQATTERAAAKKSAKSQRSWI